MSDNEAFLAFSKPFIQATQSMFETMISTNIKLGKPEFKTAQSALCEITSVIPVSGTLNQNQNYSAQFVLSFPMETYLKVASAMLMEEYTEYSEEIEDVGNEITNIVMGNAKRFLNDMGYTTSMAVPNLIVGVGHKISYPKSTRIVYFPVSSNHGDFIMEICFTKLD